MQEAVMKFLVIGGDAAGMSAASKVKRNRPKFDVTVLEQTTDVSYSACGMPYNIADPEREMDDLVVRHADVFREKQGIDLRTGCRAESINRIDKTVSYTDSNGHDRMLPYDKLLIATGASPVIPDLPGVLLPGVFALKNLEDGRRIKKYIRENSVKRAVIIGMGYIALEMCEAFRANDIDVDMVKPRPSFIPWMNGDLAEMVIEEVEKNNVRIHAGHEIMGVERHDRGLRVICSGMNIECDMALLAIGIKPNSRLAGDVGLELGPGGAVSVNKSLLTSDENIFAAGDCADAFHVVTGEKVWIPLALRANRAGWAVADNVIGDHVEIPGVVGTAAFKVFDLQVARTGLSLEEAQKAGFDPAETVITSRSRAHSHPDSSIIGVQMAGDRKSGRLLGVQMVGKEGVAHRINAPAVALHGKMSVEKFSRCDLAYAPPFSPVWDPMLTAALQLLKEM
jgi:NADPH-dependent 2,4-dienoyl-CoA reductase/sulfur reductase-like enzyme